MVFIMLRFRRVGRASVRGEREGGVGGSGMPLLPPPFRRWALLIYTRIIMRAGVCFRDEIKMDSSK